MNWTYSKAGVNLKKVKSLHKSLQELLASTLTFRKEILLGAGHYAGLIEFQDKVLALHTDGVGTKILVALKAKKLDTIGIDCVAMCVNDVICVGAEPMAFVDYLALSKANDKMVRDIMKGLVKGAEEANVSIVGGETAIIPDLLRRRAFDLVGMVLGIVDKDKLILGDKIEEGDIVIGLESSGLHSNGYTLARKVLLSKYDLEDEPEGLGRALKDELLEPTRIYVKPIIKLFKENVKLKGLAHIAGGSFTKLKRLVKKDLGFRLNLPKPFPIFELLRREGKIDEREMYRTFNMGIGLCIVCSKGEVERVTDSLQRFSIKAHQLGFTFKGKGVYINGKRID
ncbi:MAG: phosphoribosylformylglycinamidine cyclo-ligase [Nitrososphaerales archaeon]